eukprot:CAMPEP_0113659696 /NCGR_PEP_ID=MMETSP0017_2-20120614/32500_1 /TAXON_ID=2856 /ORGANISM="Cylindrotheca closterium" /LENGTH=287 /DNA_ID=CAMNT_0000574273 /DNA_START=9 /DNA_END=872 /DNA_ORIENTATION=- /assembly_acc=CAM_ASM_000147
MRGQHLLRRTPSLARGGIRPLPRQPFPKGPNNNASVPQTASNAVRSKSSAPAPPSLFQLFLERYNAALNKRPLFIKASAASVIFFASDSGTQRIMEPEKDFDLARAGSGAAFGVVATAWLHYWWGFLEVAVGKRLPTSTHRLSNTLAKVFLDQAIGAPMYIYTYFVITNFLQDWNATAKKTTKNATDLLDKTCHKAALMLPPTMMRHWTLWPAVHTFNFYYMPLHQNLVLVGWSGYLSHLNNGGLLTPDGEMEVTRELIRRKTVKLSKRKTVKLQQTKEGTVRIQQS